MGIEDAQRRLAAHVTEPEDDEPEDDLEPEPEPEEKPEALVLTVVDVLNMTGGICEPTVLGLKNIGALVDDGETMVYTLHRPLKLPATEKIRLVRTITGLQKKRMMVIGEPSDGGVIPLNHVLMTWVAALSDKSMADLDKVSSVDLDALCSIAQWIERDQGNR